MFVDLIRCAVCALKKQFLLERVKRDIRFGVSIKFAVFVFMGASLPACSLFITTPEISYSRSSDQALYQLEHWSLEGRLALTGEKDSWTADIFWDHQADEEQIKLSGPLGQGAVLIHLDEKVVTVARGDGSVESSDDPEAFINQQLGMFVPVASLRYWVVGVPEPGKHFVDTIDGFQQSGWAVGYQSMQRVGKSTLPRKLSVSNDHVKLKLIVDKWILKNGKQY